MTAAGPGIDTRYRALSVLLAPALVAWSAGQAVRARDARLFRQRLGHAPARGDRPLWLHMSSVGEVNAAAPLVDALRRRHPDLPLLVTTFTPTGAGTARRRFGPEVEHAFLPLDLGVTTRAFLRRVRPRCALIVETEIWPRLFHACAAAGVPLLIVNGRLSARTLDRPPWMRAILGAALANVDRILARSQTDADGFAALGADPARIAVPGNLKFAHADDDAAPPEAIVLPRPYVVAASTHEDEESQLARAWIASPLRTSHLLVIVPRHPKRKSAILAQLRPLGAVLAVRSDNDRVGAATEIYLADTFGELPRFIQDAALVFVGGSLVPRGGQNVLEVARLGKVALFGPHMENFADERDLLLEQGAASAVADAGELIGRMQGWLACPEETQAAGARARALVTERAGVTERYLDALAPYIMRNR